jgi:hypothetical protein
MHLEHGVQQQPPNTHTNKHTASSTHTHSAHAPTSNMASSSSRSRMLRSPRAPTPRRRASAAIPTTPAAVMWSWAPLRASVAAYCLVSALRGSVSTRASSASVSACRRPGGQAVSGVVMLFWLYG